MKNYLSLLLVITTISIYSQERPIVITGQIYLDSIPIQDVHIINKSLEVGTITNEKGMFEILVKKGDILLISHLNLEIKEHIITTENISSKNIQISLPNKTYVLNEVVIKKRKGIFEVDKDIMPHNTPIVNAKTLNLPYTETEKAKEKKTIQIKSGVAVNLEGALNALNGKNKQKKLLKRLKIEDENLLRIRKYFTDGFFVHQLKIKKEYINQFLSYSRPRGIIQLYQKEKHLELATILLENSKNFPQLTEKEKTTITSSKLKN
ncbi:carboxypeptidase-like protein [Tenacibaculum adriaticum]|uniref:Carboxypeptidase-like protein n=1 Tax=Tenacibaculum adriaticum TaxID=413713 RepID=A0A5S5DVT9_9FLAO|nr:carboxypeptidase-like regulatory domain-containing protein [Tenacibaculum adriaticum]TYP99156.1 carboxypeptidase-like protein [Tenacibaculum adriaticum]